MDLFVFVNKNNQFFAIMSMVAFLTLWKKQNHSPD